MKETQNKKVKGKEYKYWALTLPKSIAEQIEHELRDPLTDKPAHGSRARLVTLLLREWLEKKSTNVPTDKQMRKQIQLIRSYNGSLEAAVGQLLKLIQELGYPRTALTVQELYNIPPHSSGETSSSDSSS